MPERKVSERPKTDFFLSFFWLTTHNSGSVAAKWTTHSIYSRIRELLRVVVDKFSSIWLLMTFLSRLRLGWTNLNSVVGSWTKMKLVQATLLHSGNKSLAPLCQWEMGCYLVHRRVTRGRGGSEIELEENEKIWRIFSIMHIIFHSMRDDRHCEFFMLLFSNVTESMFLKVFFSSLFLGEMMQLRFGSRQVVWLPQRPQRRLNLFFMNQRTIYDHQPTMFSPFCFSPSAPTE